MAIIINFSDGDDYVLCPIFFAYEDREQITELLVETYNRLAVAASVVANIVISSAALGEKTDAIMTDSVSKNLHIEDLIGEALNSTVHCIYSVKATLLKNWMAPIYKFYQMWKKW